MKKLPEKAFNRELHFFKIFAILSILACLAPIARTYYLGQFEELINYFEHRDWDLVKQASREQGIYLFLIWNLFLAWLPLILSSWIFRNSQKTKLITKVFLGLVWLAFFPNAPYIFTDFIHYSWHPTEGLLLWYDILTIFIFAFLGFICAFVSLKQISSLIKKPFQTAFTYFVLFLSSFGIYLGRFVRLNSWDLVTNPLSIIKEVVNSLLSPFTYQFTLLVFVFIAIIFFLLEQISLLANIEGKD